jgi:polyphosphate kinase
MPRNFRRRVELMFPIEDPPLRERIINQILAIVLSDNVKARELLPDGTYRRVKPRPGEPIIRSQIQFQNLAREHADNSPMTQAVPPIGVAL